MHTHTEAFANACALAAALTRARPVSVDPRCRPQMRGPGDGPSTEGPDVGLPMQPAKSALKHADPGSPP
jgi:hypothetical protein